MPHRIHITWSGKARDLPRLSRVYADTAAALGLRLKREPLNGLTKPQALHTDTQSKPPVAARPAAVWGGAA